MGSRGLVQHCYSQNGLLHRFMGAVYSECKAQRHNYAVPPPKTSICTIWKSAWPLEFEEITTPFFHNGYAIEPLYRLTIMKAFVWHEDRQ